MSDGSQYLGAAYLQPLLAQPEAPCVADLASQALVAAYFAQQHQSTLIGTQTYPMRLRLGRSPVFLSSTSYQRIAEWCSVHLAPHHTRIEVEALFGVPVTGDSARIYLRTVVYDGTSTHTATASEYTPQADDAEGAVAGRSVVRVSNVLTLPSTNLPVSDAQVRVEAYATLEAEMVTAAAAMMPLVISAWRVGP